jgi:hypothetical protein
LELAIKYRNILENKQTDATNAQLKESAWKAIATEFNATAGSSARTHRQLKQVGVGDSAYFIMIVEANIDNEIPAMSERVLEHQPSVADPGIAGGGMCQSFRPLPSFPFPFPPSPSFSSLPHSGIPANSTRIIYSSYFDLKLL